MLPSNSSNPRVPSRWINRETKHFHLFTASAGAFRYTASGWHTVNVALQNGGDNGSREIQYVIMDHAQKRQPVYTRMLPWETLGNTLCGSEVEQP